MATNKYLIQDGTDIKKYGSIGSASTWDPTNKGPGVVLSNNNLTATVPDAYNIVRAQVGKTSGKYYWEVKLDVKTYAMVGIANESVPLNDNGANSGNARYYRQDSGLKYPGGVAYGAASSGNVIGVALDLDNGTIEFFNDGVSLGIAFTDVKTMGKVYPIVSSAAGGSGPTVTVNFGQSPFQYPAPTGFNMYTIISSMGWSVVGTAPATKSMFDTSGMTDLSSIDNAAIQQLVSASPEVLCWTDETGSPTRTFNTTAVPEAKLALPTADLTLGDFDSIRLDAVAASTYSANIIPKMTSNTAPSGKASASSFYNVSWDAWKAFDQLKDSSGSWMSEANKGEAWLAYEFATPKVIGKYAITPGWDATYINRSPATWRFEAKDANGNWVVLDTRTNQARWNISERREYTFPNAVAYKEYRLYIVSNNGDASYHMVADLEMMEGVQGSTDLKVLVSGDSGGSWKGIKKGINEVPVMTGNSNGTITLTSSPVYISPNYDAFKAFDGNQVGDNRWLSDGNLPAWLKVDFSEPKVISRYTVRTIDATDASQSPKTWTFQGSNDNSSWITLDTRTEVPGWSKAEKRSYDFNNNTAYRYYRIYISATFGAGHATISEMELFSSDVKVSVDPSNLAEVKSNGMSAAQVNGLTKADWTSIVTSRKVRFAFYLEQDKSTDTVLVDKLTVNQKEYTMTPSVSSLSVLYDLLKALEPTLYVSRDDGANWKQVDPDVLTKISDLPSGKALRVKAVLSNGQELHGLSYSWI